MAGGGGGGLRCDGSMPVVLPLSVKPAVKK